MSSNLDNSAALAGASAFQNLVLAAIREYAITAITDRTGDLPTMQLRHELAQAVIHDAKGYVEKFAGIVADDATISGTADPAAVDREQVRAVVATVWVSVAASTPGLG